MIERKIVFVNQATGYLTIDIINAFVNSNNFKKVALISGFIRVHEVPINPSVIHSKINVYDRSTLYRKLFSWLIGTFRILFLLVTKYRNYEIFYITIPPFAYLLSLFLPQRFSILIFDVYPDILSVYGIKRTNLIFRFWSFVNRNIFAKAFKIFTIGEGMKIEILKYVNKDKIVVIPNWSSLSNLKKISKEDNVFRKRFHLENKFIIQYSGNIGYTHNIQVLLDLSKILIDETEIMFLIIGRGEKFDKLERQFNFSPQKNCLILPFQPDELLNASLACADLGVILLDPKTENASIPSKIYNLQKVGVGLLCIADPNSEICHHVESFKNGRCFLGDDLFEIKEWILELKDCPSILGQISLNSLKASESFTSDNANSYLKEYLS